MAIGHMELAVSIPCQGALLAGIHHKVPESPLTVIFIAGQPQTRVGPHRLFVSLARAFAQHGFSSLRFDCQGWGDSSGKKQHHEHSWQDLAAVTHYLAQQNDSGAILWLGLCDGATASLYALAQQIQCAGLILLNPQLISEQAHSQALLNAHYLPMLQGRRQLFHQFKKQFSQPLQLPAKIASLLKHLWQAKRDSTSKAPLNIAQQELLAIQVPSLLVLSSKDMTAQQAFHPIAHALELHPQLTLRWMKDADHTFSTQSHKDILCAELISFLISHPSHATHTPNEAIQ